MLVRRPPAGRPVAGLASALRATSRRSRTWRSALIGEGDRDPRRETRVREPGARGRARIRPVTLAAKEGLALINGVQMSVAVGGLALARAIELTRVADLCGAALARRGARLGRGVRSARRRRPAASRARSPSAGNLRRLLAGSAIRESHRGCGRVQDNYALRCMPQVHGAARDAFAHAREVLEREMNSATDNPLVFAGSGRHRLGRQLPRRAGRSRPRLRRHRGDGPRLDLRAANREARQPGALGAARLPRREGRAPFGPHDGAGHRRRPRLGVQDRSRTRRRSTRSRPPRTRRTTSRCRRSRRESSRRSSRTSSGFWRSSSSTAFQAMEFLRPLRSSAPLERVRRRVPPRRSGLEPRTASCTPDLEKARAFLSHAASSRAMRPRSPDAGRCAASGIYSRPCRPTVLTRPDRPRARADASSAAAGWAQEAALRMLENNLDPEVAEKPEDLIVYGGTGKAARNWECFDTIVATLKRLAFGRDAARPVGQARRRLRDARRRAAGAHRQLACSSRPGRRATSSAASRGSA